MDTATTTTSASAQAVLAKGADGHTMTLLPESFEPSEWDVICGRGSRIYNSKGNVRFRQIVGDHLVAYNSAQTKVEKTHVLSTVVTLVREAAQRGDSLGGFVKKSEDVGNRWHEVGDFLAREKTSQAFRDILHQKYSSSNEAKKRKRSSKSDLLSCYSTPNFSTTSTTVVRQKQQQQLSSEQQNPLILATQNNKRRFASTNAMDGLRLLSNNHTTPTSSEDWLYSGGETTAAQACMSNSVSFSQTGGHSPTPSSMMTTSACRNFEWGAGSFAKANPQLFASIVGASSNNSSSHCDVQQQQPLSYVSSSNLEWGSPPNNGIYPIVQKAAANAVSKKGSLQPSLHLSFETKNILHHSTSDNNSNNNTNAMNTNNNNMVHVHHTNNNNSYFMTNCIHTTTNNNNNIIHNKMNIIHTNNNNYNSKHNNNVCTNETGAVERGMTTVEEGCHESFASMSSLPFATSVCHHHPLAARNNNACPPSTSVSSLSSFLMEDSGVTDPLLGSLWLPEHDVPHLHGFGFDGDDDDDDDNDDNHHHDILKGSFLSLEGDHDLFCCFP